MRRIFKTRHFSRWMRKTELTDHMLCKAVQEMMQGLIDADLGGKIVKKRVAAAGRGKRGGARTLVATKKEIDGSTFLALKRMNEPISQTMNWKPCRKSQQICWPEQAGNWMRQ